MATNILLTTNMVPVIGITIHLFLFVIIPKPKAFMPDPVKNLVIGAIIIYGHTIAYDSFPLSWHTTLDASFNMLFKYLLVISYWHFSRFKSIDTRYFASQAIAAYLTISPSTFLFD